MLPKSLPFLQRHTYSFHGTIKDRRGKYKAIFLQRATKIHIERHVLVKGANSRDDPSLVKYWEERQKNTGKKYWERGSLKHQVAENQKWKCPVCGESLFNGEDLQIHHITKVTDGGMDEGHNLTHLHKACHRHIHSGKSLQEA